MNGTSRHRQPVRATKLALIALATVASAIVLPATAQADNDDQQFASPSGRLLPDLARLVRGRLIVSQ